MKSVEFCYWLQGYFELSECSTLTAAQVQMIRNHLALVFKHEIDPSYGGDAKQLQAIHDGVLTAFTKNKIISDHLSSGSLDGNIRC